MPIPGQSSMALAIPSAISERARESRRDCKLMELNIEFLR
jgi:hypothetical protein